MTDYKSKVERVKRLRHALIKNVETRIGGENISKCRNLINSSNEFDNYSSDDEYTKYLGKEIDENSDDEVDNFYKKKQNKKRYDRDDYEECDKFYCQKKVKDTKENNKKDHRECPICFDDIDNVNNVCILECGHCFCNTCVNNWTSFGKDNCPLCRKPIPKKQIPHKKTHKHSQDILEVDYVFLDTEERKKFSQVDHEYLIEELDLQQDYIKSNKKQNNFKLNFNHPVKELAFSKGIMKTL